MKFNAGLIFSLVLLTRSSAAPSGPATRYLIFPVESATQDEQNALIDLLNKELTPGNYEITNLTRIDLQFVSANLTAAQISNFNTSSLVSEVIPDFHLDPEFGRRSQYESRHYDILEIREVEEPEGSDWIAEAYENLERRAAIHQAKALDELKVFSQPPGTKLSDVKSYTYDDSAGEDITVYVLDSGYYIKNGEYTGLKTAPRWIFAGSQKAASKQEDLEKGGHGSCCGSKVNGPNYGIAKSANLVVVKAATTGDTLDGLSEIYSDVVARNLQGKAVINLSMGFREPSLSVQRLLTYYIEDLVAADVVVVASAGNDPRELKAGETAADIDAYPQLLASDALPIINVGAVDNEGKNASFSQGGPLVTVMAPGVGITCAANSFFSGTQTLDGTSFAAPAVAGLAAYLLALGQYPEVYKKGSVAKNMRDLIQQMAYARVTGGLPVAFNGEGATCRISGPSKRAIGGACEANSTQSKSPTISPTKAPKPLFTLKESIKASQTNCFPTTPFTTKPNTYGFSFKTSTGILVQIGKDSSGPTYYQGMGSGNGSFYADDESGLNICATNNGNVAVDLVWDVYAAGDIWTLVMPMDGGVDKFQLYETVRAGVTCYGSNSGTNGFVSVAGTGYTFSYTFGDNTVMSIADENNSAGPNYFQGKGAENEARSGSMYLTASSALNICFNNQGSGNDKVSLTIHSSG